MDFDLIKAEKIMKTEISMIGLGFLVVYYLNVDGPWAFLGFLDLELD